MHIISYIRKFIRHLLISVRNFDPQDITLWLGGSLESFELDKIKTCINFSASNVQFESLLQSPQFSLSPGVYDISVRGDIATGSCMFGVLDIKRNKWVVTQAMRNLGGRSRVVVPIVQSEHLQLIISANNSNASGPVSGMLSQVVIALKGDASDAESMIAKQAEKAGRALWRQEEQPRQLLEKLDADIKNHKFSHRNNYYAVIEAAQIGYAARSTISVSFNDKLYVLVANAGDDTVTLLEREQVGDPLKWKCDLQFPEYCTPIDLQKIQSENDTLIGICFFHMQKVASAFGDTGYGTVSFNWILERSESDQPIKVNKSEIRMLYSRRGYWGARNSSVIDGGALGRWLAIADRDESNIVLFYQSQEDKVWRTPPEVISLEEGFEPVGISGLIRGQKAVFYIASRLLPKLAIIEATLVEEAKVISLVNIDGLSRSSVAIGKFDGGSGLSLAIGLWGGKPTDVTTLYKGSVFCSDISDDGSLTNHSWFTTGINTTDVVVGDLDNDGFDELVVLNYGNGLNLEERSDLGNLQIFKKSEGIFKCLSTHDLPTPRIGLVADFDGDGRDELGVTLFHEKRLVIIKYIQ